MPYVNGMIVQSDGSKPHVVYVMTTLAEEFPNIIWKLGGMVDRKTREGGESFHATGQACDIYLDASHPPDKALGDLLFGGFQSHSADLKVDHTIWDTQIWSKEFGGPTHFTEGNGGPHRDHVHVAFADDHLEQTPWVMYHLCQILKKTYEQQYADWMDGLYGRAFDPRHPNVRLSARKRREHMLRAMGLPKGL